MSVCMYVKDLMEKSCQKGGSSSHDITINGQCTMYYKLNINAQILFYFLPTNYDVKFFTFSRTILLLLLYCFW